VDARTILKHTIKKWDGGGGKKIEATLVTGRGVPYGFETSRLPYFLDNRLTEGGKVGVAE
jgi:hypothetical protein